MTIDDSPLPLPTPPDADSGQPSQTPDAGGASPGEQLGVLLRSTLEPVLATTSRLEQRLAQTEARLQQQQMQPPAQPAGPALTAEQAAEAKVKAFIADPDAYERQIVERTSQEVAKRLAPYIHGPARSAQESSFERQQQRVDRIYGEGSFDKHIRPHLQTLVSNMPEPLRFDPDAIQRGVDALLGSDELRPTLDEARDTARRAKAEAAKQRPASPFGSPRASMGSLEPEITDQDRAVMAALDKSGFTLSEDRLRTLRKLPQGASFEEMLDAEDKLTGKGKQKGAAAS